MNTLLSPTLATLLAQLFAEDQVAHAAFRQGTVPLSAEERTRLLTSATEYQALYSRMKDVPLAVSRATGTLLYMLARAIGARSIVEFGTSFGISTLHLGAALKDNGGGHLIGTEAEPAKIKRARANIEAAGLSALIEIREGDALQTLAHDLPDPIDLVLLDGAKALYPKILSLLDAHLRPGAFVIADNVDYSPDYVAWVRSPEKGYLSVPFAEDVELSMKL
jgi:predicted O-methyltransferase YrrM